MRHALASTLDRLGPRLSRDLVPVPSWERLLAAADWIPASVTRSVYIETRLAAADGRTDLIFAVEPAGADLVAGRNPALRLPSELARRQGWSQAAEFCRRWRAGAPWSDSVQRLWLEVDLPAAPGDREAAPPPAGVFVEYDASALAGPDGGSPARTVRQTLRALAGSRLRDGREGAVEACVRRLPGPEHLPYVGVLFPRGGRDVRLCLDGLGREQVLSYLGRTGWPGSLDRMSRLALELEDRKDSRETTGFGLVHLDVARDVRGRIGLEYVFDRRPQVRGVIREQAFLDHLSQRGWCTAVERRALETWPGCARTRLPHRLEPLLEIRRVNNVKVVLEPGEAARVKAYLFARHEYRDL